MGKLYISGELLALEENKKAIAKIEKKIGEKLQPGETIVFRDGGCSTLSQDGCPDGYSCVMGHCVKNPIP